MTKTHAEDQERMKHIMTFLNGMAVHEQVWPVFWGKKYCAIVSLVRVD
jgi:hypothetical protein